MSFTNFFPFGRSVLQATIVVKLVFLVLTATALAQEVVSEDAVLTAEVFKELDAVKDLDAMLTKLDEKRKFSGTVLIAQEGNILFEKSIGTTQGDKHVPFETNSSFRLASVSKQFTAMAGSMRRRGI